MHTDLLRAHLYGAHRDDQTLCVYKQVVKISRNQRSIELDRLVWQKAGFWRKKIYMFPKKKLTRFFCSPLILLLPTAVPTHTLTSLPNSQYININ
jgi:hypothetical protein